MSGNDPSLLSDLLGELDIDLVRDLVFKLDRLVDVCEDFDDDLLQ